MQRLILAFFIAIIITGGSYIVFGYTSTIVFWVTFAVSFLAFPNVGNISEMVELEIHIK